MGACYEHLSYVERIEIADGRRAGLSSREIGRRLCLNEMVRDSVHREEDGRNNLQHRDRHRESPTICYSSKIVGCACFALEHRTFVDGRGYKRLLIGRTVATA